MAGYPYNNYNYQSPYGQNFVQPQYQNRGIGIDVMYATEAEATTYLVEAGKKIMFILTDKPMAIIKGTDGLGFSTTEYYKMEKINNKKAPEFNPGDYVKKSDLDEITNQIKDLYSKIGVKDEQ